jgi:BirA family biotin operon repressor/biotin-[acetyl-CoA-carboxylase] ligase
MPEYPRSAGGTPVVLLDTVGSTNEVALERARSGERGPLWIAAERQTAGRGRRRRAWTSEPGNLHASLLLTDAAPPVAVAGICFVAALALHDALLDSVHGLAPAQVRLKWPNDVLLDGRKLAGILVEGSSGSDGTTVTVIGFGVNCRRHPEQAEYPATDLTSAGFPAESAQVLEALGDSMTRRLLEWDRGANFAAVRSAWLARASGLGSEIKVRLNDRTILGRFEAIDPSGALVLAQADGTRETITAGDVFPLNG